MMGQKFRPAYQLVVSAFAFLWHQKANLDAEFGIELPGDAGGPVKGLKAECLELSVSQIGGIDESGSIGRYRAAVSCKLQGCTADDITTGGEEGSTLGFAAIGSIGMLEGFACGPDHGIDGLLVQLHQVKPVPCKEVIAVPGS